MDKEFHYYITYLVAAKAGFSANDAYTIAFSAQYTDDNNLIFKIDEDGEFPYSNYISQTMNILKPKKELLRIYPLFHFIPGDYKSPTAVRKDGKLHLLNTTPDSENANKIIDLAIKSGDLYRIGIACHAYADTFAHQNFVGYFDPFNSLKGMLEEALPDVGHADAQHKPDLPGFIWQDERLHSKISRVNNKERFIQAAARIYEKLRNFKRPQITQIELDHEIFELKSDLDNVIGRQVYEKDNLASERITRYLELSKTAEYGSESLREFNIENWLFEAVNGPFEQIDFKLNELLSHVIPNVAEYNWKNPGSHTETDWYKFQEAVKTHQNESWDILNESVFSKLELEQL